MNTPDYALGLHAQLACVWETTARKPGNVHRFHDFADMTYLDFVASAAAIAPVLAMAPHYPVGTTICECIRLRCGVTHRNTNLGMTLLFAPLATAERSSAYRAEVERVLTGLTVEDAVQAYYGIRLAQAGGLGAVSQQDVSTEPTVTLREAMALAADRDLIARQYVNGFAQVFDEGVPALLSGIQNTGCLEGAIIETHLRLLATHPDSLIARKRGLKEAEEASARARAVLEAGWPLSEQGRTEIRRLDDWLRAIGHQRNPGTTADLVAASLFVALRMGDIGPNREIAWTRPSLFPQE